MEILKPFLVLLVGIATGFLDSTVGNGGSVSIPSLILLGLPPQVAIATDRLGTVGQSSASFLRFSNSKKIIWPYVPVFVVLSLIATAIGANILIIINPQILQRLVGAVILIVLPLVFLKRNIGISHQSVSLFKRIFGFVNYFLLMVLNGFLGVGSGTTSSFNSLFFFGFTFIESNATNKIPEFLLAILSLIIFWQHGIVNLSLGIFLLIGMAIGGFLGAHTAIKKGEHWIKRIFVVVVILSCVKLLFFS